jgi:hypothetical protein
MTAAFNLSQLANGANTSGQLNASSYLYNQVPVANGGTALSSAGAAGNMLIASSASAYSAVAMPTFGFRNRIINGAMMIDQRYGGASVTPTADSFYTLDRWAARLSVASKYSVQQNAGAVTPPAGFINYLGITSLSAYTVGASEFFAIEQNIEGLNMTDLGWGTASAQAVTLSFRVYSSLTGTFGGVLFNQSGTRSYPFSYSVGSANTWTTISLTIPGDTAGTWLTTNSGFVTVSFGLGAGATVSGTAGAWAGSLYRSATGAVSVVGTNAAKFYITGVQLEKSSIATAFDVRPYGTELALCQRYYEAASFNSMYFQSGTFSFSSGVVFYKVAKRAVPSVVVSSDGVSGRVSITDTPTYDSAVNLSGDAFSFSATGTSNAFRSKIAFNYTASSEL